MMPPITVRHGLSAALHLKGTKCMPRQIREGAGRREQFGTLTCGQRPHKLSADAHVCNWAGRLSSSSFDLHHLSAAKMSRSVHKKKKKAKASGLLTGTALAMQQMYLTQAFHSNG